MPMPPMSPTKMLIPFDSAADITVYKPNYERVYNYINWKLMDYSHLYEGLLVLPDINLTQEKYLLAL